ncbi:DUF5596 domain-containing protein [Thermobifida halotolerans]|uniref:DUF5596 domain-containing protein n=1 Tax=Thermobifida halotolerans TaxID=483545 RepID=A0A399G5T0_9ACTN|nr:acyltransferase domain-containing protein [Thermobifida halotolerans]UOE21022.1 DUF5596 domain-containing protein [Thermobifida halotolerans]
MDLSATARALGLAADAAPTLASLADFPAPEPAPLPPPEAARGVLDALAFDEADRADLLALWPAPDWPDTARWLLDACHARVVADQGRPGWVDWPDLTSADDARVRCAPVYAFLAATPLLREQHRRRGVPADVTAATLADVGRHVAKTRRMYGRVGLDLPVWIALHYRGSLLEVGRLQYETARLDDGDFPGVAELAGGQPLARLHIPASGPLAPEAVDASLARARAVLAAVTGQEVRVATCTSWLLDPQLRRYLPAGSNILAFQDRFTLTDRVGPGDADVFRFVFECPEVAPDRVEPASRLQRGVLDLLERGGSWRVRTGWLRLP